MRNMAILWLSRAIIVALGGLMAMAMPLPSWWWLGWLGVAPVIVVVAIAPTRREALLRAWMGGAGFLVSLHYWLIPHLGVFTVPVAAFAGLFWIPLGVAVWSYLAPGSRYGSRPLWALAVVPAVWVAIEGIRAWEYLGGTWGLWGLSQWQVGPVLQVASLGGVWLLSLLLLVTNVGLAVAVLPGVRQVQRGVALAVAVAVPVVMVAYGLLRPDAPVSGEVAVAAIQPGVIESAEERLEAHLELTRSVAGFDPEFVVWGQSSVGFDPQRRPEVVRSLQEVSGHVGLPLLVNIDAEVDEGRIRKVFVHYTAEGPQARYAKQRLVPFGEYIPLRPVFGWVADFTEAAVQDRARGQESTTIPVAGVEVGPLISYESTFPAMRRRLALLGAEMTVVQGGTWTFQGTWAQPQQASFEAVRAVASGRPSLLAAVSGTSAAFDARGRLIAWRPADWEGAYLVDIPLSQEQTLYVRYGDWALWLAWVVTGAASILGAARWLPRR